MKSSAILFTTFLILGVVLMRGGCDEDIRRPRRLTQIWGFSWQNCGKPDDPAVLKALQVSPDPITIPGDLTASAAGSTSVALVSPLSVNVTLEKEVAGIWVKIPCVEEIGSCHYPDGCNILNQLIPPGQDCPEPLRTYGLPCHCPFKAGDYTLPQSDFYLPHIDLPFWLTNGNYRVQGVLGSADKELGCLKVSLTVHSAVVLRRAWVHGLVSSGKTLHGSLFWVSRPVDLTKRESKESPWGPRGHELCVYLTPDTRVSAQKKTQET